MSTFISEAVFNSTPNQIVLSGLFPDGLPEGVNISEVRVIATTETTIEIAYIVTGMSALGNDPYHTTATFSIAQN